MKPVRMLASVILILSQVACASRVRIHNSKSEFNQLIANSNLVSQDEFSRSWQTFEERYSQIYEKLFPLNDKEARARKASQLKLLQEALPGLQVGIDSFYDHADSIIGSQFARFSKVFPDVKDRKSVYVIPSLLTFNGKVIELPSKEGVLLLGVDKIVQRHDDLDVLFSHEFFHLYHADQTPRASSWKTFAVPLWVEGLATYVSILLNPGKSEAAILMDDELAKHCVSKPFVTQRAHDFLEVIDKTEKDNGSDKIYTDWFLLRGSVKPVRSAYCLGLEVVRRLAKEYELAEMVRWDEDSFSPHVKQVLRDLSNGH